MAIGAFPPALDPRWALGGPVFVGIELVAHLGLWLAGRPSVYDGRG